MDSTESQMVAIEPDPATAQLVEVHWILTRRCQYSCWYCPPHRHDPKASHADESELLRGLDRIVEYLDGNPTRINLTGGEPTLHPSVTAFVRSALASEPIHSVRIVSNLAGPLSLFESLADVNLRHEGVQVVGSFHTERAQIQPFMERVSVLAAADVPVLIKVMGREDQPEESSRIVGEFQEAGLPTGVDIAVQTIRQTRSGEAQSDRDLETLRKWNNSRMVRFPSGRTEPLDAQEVVEKEENRFLGWTCEVGRYSLFVDSDGSFHAALCKPHGEPLANLFDPEDSLPVIRSVQCPHDVCGCASTVRIPKHDPQSSAKQQPDDVPDVE